MLICCEGEGRGARRRKMAGGGTGEDQNKTRGLLGGEVDAVEGLK